MTCPYPLQYQLVSHVTEYTLEEWNQINELYKRRKEIDLQMQKVKVSAIEGRQRRRTLQYAQDCETFKRLLPQDTGICIFIHRTRSRHWIYMTNGIQVWEQFEKEHKADLIQYCNRDEVHQGSRILFEMLRMLERSQALLPIVAGVFNDLSDIAWIILTFAVEYETVIVSDQF